MISFYDVHRAPLRLIYGSLMRIEIEGAWRLPRSGGVVMVSNHLTDLDPLLLGILFSRPLRFMAKEELFHSKPLSWWLRRVGTFPVKRGEPDRAALKHAEALLRAGEVLMIFPEGTRGSRAQVQAARAGAALLAARTGCPIVPVAIAGTERLRLRGAPDDSLARFFRRPRVRVRVASPIWIEPGATGARNRQALADLMMRRIVALLPPAYHGAYADSDESLEQPLPALP